MNEAQQEGFRQLAAHVVVLVEIVKSRLKVDEDDYEKAFVRILATIDQHVMKVREEQRKNDPAGDLLRHILGEEFGS